jgi:hypothetical protein
METLIAPSTINGIPLKTVMDILVWLREEEPIVIEADDKFFLKYSPDRQIQVFEALESQACYNCHPVEILDKNEFYSLVEQVKLMVLSGNIDRDDSFSYDQWFWQITRKQLTALCHAVYRVMDIVDAIGYNDVEHIIHTREFGLIAEALGVGNNDLATIVNGKSVAAMIPFFAECGNLALVENANIIDVFIKKFKMVDCLLKQN